MHSRGLPKSGRRGGAHQADEHPIKSFLIQVNLDLHRLQRQCRLVSLRPSQRISVTGSLVEIDAHVARLLFRDDRGIDPRGSGKFVPHNIGARSGLVKARNIVGQRSSRFVDLLDHRARQPRLDRNIGGSADHLLPRRTQHNLRSLGIKPEIELVTRGVDELRVVGLRSDPSTHED